ncbi:hypothetical protein KKH81_02990 [Patescibacteria group bacterium]|nr:hypothetical protein [Patescibacteria group bacterium]
MTTTEKQPFAHAMAFYHQDGLPAAWKQAMKFAGKGGRLASMPDIVAARLETKPGALPWETYFTTLTAEYYGFSKSGKRILIVAHGVGPMATLEGAQKAYSWEYQDKERNHRGGRITAQEFLDLEAGKFGEVSIVDLEEYVGRYQYPFIQTLRSSEALVDPVLKARFGPQAEEYVQAHTAAARMWHREQAGLDPENKYELPNHDQFLDRRRSQHERDGAENSDPYILKVDGAGNCCYFFGNRHGFREIEEGMAITHLVSTGSLSHLHHEGNESLVLDVSCHEWWNGVRVVGIQAGGNIRSGLNKGPDAYKLLRKYWRDLLVPVKKQEDVGFRGLVQIGDQWFTQYPKIGEGMDTWEPEFVVTSMEKVGAPVVFRTTVGGYHGFFKFGVNEVQAIAPPNANAYFFVGEPQNEWNDGNPTHQTCEVQFYRIEADTSKRMVRADKLVHDYDTMMKLVAKETATA